MSNGFAFAAGTRLCAEAIATLSFVAAVFSVTFCTAENHGQTVVFNAYVCVICAGTSDMGPIKRRRTVADFINGLQLDKNDQERLVEHIQKRALAATGPRLDSPCNQHFR